MVLKLEYSEFHATFIDLNIPLSNGKVSIKLYDKHDDFFLLSACQTCDGTVMSETIRIATSSSSVISFYEKTSALITRMEKQGGNRGKLIKEIKRAYANHQLSRSMIYQRTFQLYSFLGYRVEKGVITKRSFMFYV